MNTLCLSSYQTLVIHPVTQKHTGQQCVCVSRPYMYTLLLYRFYTAYFPVNVLQLSTVQYYSPDVTIPDK